MTDYTYFKTFVFDGKEYPLNTIVKTKSYYVWKYRIGDLRDYKMVQIVESYLDLSGTNRWKYALWNENGRIFSYITSTSPDELIDCIIQSADNFEAPSKKTEYYKDSEAPDVVIGWYVYIAVMIGSLIFKEFIVAFVLESICFFLWRESKLRKPEKICYGFNVYEKVREWNER